MATVETLTKPPGSVTGYFTHDHDRLDELLAQATAFVEDGRLGEALRAFAKFETGLDRHIRIEEELLFPVFEVRSGMTDGPTEVMRVEHREIRRVLQTMRVALERSEAQAFREGRAFLMTILPGHNAKEEHILYPATDALLAPAERAVFLVRIQSE